MRFLVFLLVAFADAGLAHAQLGLRVGEEQFRWREWNRDGSRLLQERGSRLRIGLAWDAPLAERLRFELDGSLYFGDIDYDGQAGPPGGPYAPFASDTAYRGIAANAGIAFFPGAARRFHVFGGAGVDAWRRDIAGRGHVIGVVEHWTLLHAYAGLGAAWRAGGDFRARLGVKRPLYVHEVADAYDVALHPRPRAACFLRLVREFGPPGKPYLALGAFYDRYRFDESARERVGSIIIWQPQSRQDLLGLDVTIYWR